ncbi:uncharacterized protein DC041_0012807 [Schistosoma bovis]|uniref:Hexosyltransferase n=1 Tax=Schistosoma bovis TaxID=6184 RepID=A0A430QI89_SCHBO|nr:uncharacterized protein DC041_0012807 [Schistosoma bovis]
MLRLLIKISIKFKRIIYAIYINLFLFYSIIYILNRNNLNHLQYLRNYTICSYNKLEEITQSKIIWMNFIYQSKFIHHHYDYLKQITITNSFTHFMFFYNQNDQIQYNNNNNNTILLDLKIHYNIRYDNRIIYHFNDDYSMKNESFINYTILTRNEIGEPVTFILMEHHPKQFNVTEALQAISSGLSLNDVCKTKIPCNNNDLIAIRLPKRTCDPCSRSKNVDLVVIVKSCVYCFEQRVFARKTYLNKDMWKNFRVQFVFTGGLPTPNETNTYHFDGFMTTPTIDAMQLSSKHDVSKWSAVKILSNERIGYFLGADVVHDASFAMPFTKQLRIDDVYLGIILKRLNRTLTHLKNIHINPGKDQLKSGAFMITRYLAENHVDWTTELIIGKKGTQH